MTHRTDQHAIRTQIAAIANGLPIYYGVGNPIAEPHVVVRAKDALNEGIGYYVTVKPEGDGYMKPCHVHELTEG
jgi:hypothetical protein